MYAKLAWEKYTDEQIKDVMAFNEGYKNFITNGKTERLCVKQSIELAKENGFKELSEYLPIGGLKNLGISVPTTSLYASSTSVNSVWNFEGSVIEAIDG